MKSLRLRSYNKKKVKRELLLKILKVSLRQCSLVEGDSLPKEKSQNKTSLILISKQTKGLKISWKCQRLRNKEQKHQSMI